MGYLNAYFTRKIFPLGVTCKGYSIEDYIGQKSKVQNYQNRSRERPLFLRFPVGVGVGSLDSRFNYHSPSLYLEVETFRVGRLGHARLF